MEATANCAVSFVIPTLTHPALAPTSYTPSLSGPNGLNQDFDYIRYGNGPWVAFGDGGTYEAKMGGATLYDFKFTYADGSYYYGTVADDGTYGYFVGETMNGKASGSYVSGFPPPPCNARAARHDAAHIRDVESHIWSTIWLKLRDHGAGSMSGSERAAASLER